MKWISRIITVVLITLLVGVALMVLSTKLIGGEPEVFGYQLKTVLSGSMEPGIQTGSIIAVKSVTDGADFKEGDVITFMEADDKLITHRITEVKQTGDGANYTTKGDNNNGADLNPVLSENVVGAYSGVTIPYIGYLIHFTQSPKGSLLFLIVPGILMLGYSFITIRGTLKDLEEKDKGKPADVK